MDLFFILVAFVVGVVVGLFSTKTFNRLNRRFFPNNILSEKKRFVILHKPEDFKFPFYLYDVNQGYWLTKYDNYEEAVERLVVLENNEKLVKMVNEE